jgi:hypothetical protein
MALGYLEQGNKIGPPAPLRQKVASTEQKAILKDADMKALRRQVLSGAPEGLDEESLKAGVTLLIEIETRKILLSLLQTHMLFARIRENGVPVFYAGDAKADSRKIV